MAKRKNSKLSMWLYAVLIACLMALGCDLFTVSADEKAYAAVTPRYLLNGSVNYVGNLPFGGGYNKTANYSDITNLSDYFTVHLYSESYSGEQIASQEQVFNFTFVTFVANVISNASPHNQNYPFAHESYSLINNTTGSVVESGTLSGVGERTLTARSLSDGYYTLKYTAGGKRSGIGGGTITDYFSYSFYVDATPPAYSMKAGGAEAESGTHTKNSVIYSASDARFDRIYYKKPSASGFDSTSSTSYAVSATVENNGEWTFYAEDSVGNRNSEVTIYIDTLPPVGRIICGGTTAASGSYVNQAFSYEATDSGGIESYEYKTPSSDVWKSYTAGKQIGVSSQNGWYYFRARDYGGQYSVEQCVYFDTVKPIGKLYSDGKIVGNNAVTNASVISFVGSDAQSGLQNVYVKKPGASRYVQTANGSQFAAVGTYSFYCTDKSGLTSDIFTITIDRSAPRISCNETEFGGTTDKGFTVTASKKDGNATLYYRYETEAWKTKGGKYTVPDGAKEGKYSFYAVDDNKNETEVVWIVLSTTKPVGTFVKSKEDNSVYFTWDNDYWTATLDGQPYEKGVWIEAEGEHVVVLSNNAGLISTYEFTIAHNYIVTKTVKPTCAERGYTLMECSRCGKTQTTDFVKQLEHVYAETNTPANCTENGKRTFTCLACGHEYILDGEQAMGHRYVSTVLCAATCTTNGERFHVCEKCNYSYTVEIPASGHRYEISDAETNEGLIKRTYICNVCGDSYTQDLGNQYEKVTSYVEYLFDLYSPYMIWVFLATSGVWSVVLGVIVIIARRNEDKEKAKKTIVNYVIGLVVIFCILVACPYLVKGIATLIG